VRGDLCPILALPLYQTQQFLIILLKPLNLGAIFESSVSAIAHFLISLRNFLGDLNPIHFLFFPKKNQQFIFLLRPDLFVHFVSRFLQVFPCQDYLLNSLDGGLVFRYFLENRSLHVQERVGRGRHESPDWKNTGIKSERVEGVRVAIHFNEK
jgi:hypothetical protein